MPSDRPSRADLDMVKRLQDAGVADMTWTRLKRWRKAGLIPSPQQVRVAGRRGSGSDYPPAAFEQALAAARLLERHRDFDKVAVLLFFGGFEVDAAALRCAFVRAANAIHDHIERTTAGAVDAEEQARRLGEGVVRERRRTGQARTVLSKQLELAGGEERLIGVYSKLARPLIGASLPAGGLFSAFKTVGQDMRERLGLDEAAFSQLEQVIDRNDRELMAEGGALALLRAHLESMQLEHFVAMRTAWREVASWIQGMGWTFAAEGYDQFSSDFLYALFHREVPA